MLRLAAYLTSLTLMADWFKVHDDRPTSLWRTHCQNNIFESPFTSSSVFNISSCPILYYGREYQEIYINSSFNLFVACFGDYFRDDSHGDCVIIPPLLVGHYSSFIDSSRVFHLKNVLKSNMPHIKTPAKCAVAFKFKEKHTGLSFLNFHTEAAIYFQTKEAHGPVLFNFLVDGRVVDTMRITHRRAVSVSTFVDVSACRYSGGIFRPNSLISSDPDKCDTLMCDHNSILREKNCGPGAMCQGNNICVLTESCIVIGRSVITFSGGFTVIPDRCVYSLISVPGFEVMAEFKERRQMDVSLLDSVILKVGDVSFSLEQGGNVYLEDDLLNINGSVGVFHGVELSKDQTGVRAKVSLDTGHNILIHFDGFAAHIDYSGPGGKGSGRPGGLCFDPTKSSIKKHRLLKESTTRCHVRHKDNASINCTRALERCSVLQEAEPFVSCNSKVDPEHFIAACTNLLCNYPHVDGLYCHVLETFARTCKIKDWRDAFGCSPPVCLNHSCSLHEFCGVSQKGAPSCFCRALFALPYKSTKSYGDPTVCQHNSASVILIACLLVEEGFDVTALRLNDRNCTGRKDKVTNTIRFSFSDSEKCGGEIITNDTHVIYRNTIMTVQKTPLINRLNSFYMDLSCVAQQPPMTHLTINTRKPESAVMHSVVEMGAYSPVMTVFTDVGLTEAVDRTTEVHSEQKLWVGLSAGPMAGDRVTLVIDSCRVTNKRSSRYNLIMDGCPNPADQKVAIESNGVSGSSLFSFNLFQFQGSSGEVDLHCSYHLCLKKGLRCVQECNGATTRTEDEDDEEDTDYSDEFLI